MAIGLTDIAETFLEDVLKVEISEPDRPHLTIVDLLGFIHVENKLKTAVDVNIV